MGKRLTPEERAARIKEYEEAKAARQAARLEKRKARIEAYEKAKAKREYEKKGVRPVHIAESSKVGQVKKFPTYKGEIKVGDILGFRWLGMAMAGTLQEIKQVRNFRVRDDGSDDLESTGAIVTYYDIQELSEGTVYSIKRNDILAKKVNNVWLDSCKD